MREKGHEETLAGVTSLQEFLPDPLDASRAISIVNFTAGNLKWLVDLCVSLHLLISADSKAVFSVCRTAMLDQSLEDDAFCILNNDGCKLELQNVVVKVFCWLFWHQLPR